VNGILSDRCLHYTVPETIPRDERRFRGQEEADNRFSRFHFERDLFPFSDRSGDSSKLIALSLLPIAFPRTCYSYCEQPLHERDLSFKFVRLIAS